MGDTKLAKSIYSLAMEVENGKNESAGGAGYEAQQRKEARDKTAERMVQFQDSSGNIFLLPYSLVGASTPIYSPYDRSRAERLDILNVSLTGKAEVFSPTSSTKVAKKMVRFQDESGRTFILPMDDVGYARWAYSPWERTKAKRLDIINVQTTGKLEKALGLS